LTIADESAASRFNPDDMIEIMPMGDMAEWNVLIQLLKRDTEPVVDLFASAGQTK
jgi:hypothetical protein